MSKYKRLTKWDDEYGIITLCSSCSKNPKCACDKHDAENVHCIDEAYSRLAYLEDKIENGTLVELPFVVIDKKTKKEADWYKIALKEDWAKGLCYCDMDGFAITQDGSLILLDECGNFTYCPDDRFEVISEEQIKELQ